jgi:hypothetical protein
LGYLGGERALLILVHGRPPKDPVFPVNLFRSEIDVSDPYTFLALKRGIIRELCLVLQVCCLIAAAEYVQIKPLLAFVTLILKATGHYNEGELRWDAGYLYISVIYNFSIFVALYCLAMFWLCVAEDLKPFR